MASIVFADSTLHYDGRDLERRPLGGTETSVIRCSRELARRGHQVTCFTNCDGPVEHEGVSWRPLSSTPPQQCDLYIACQQPYLLPFVSRPKRRAIWVVWPVSQLRHYKKIWRMWLYRPIPILTSFYEATGLFAALAAVEAADRAAARLAGRCEGPRAAECSAATACDLCVEPSAQSAPTGGDLGDLDPPACAECDPRGVRRPWHDRRRRRLEILGGRRTPEGRERSGQGVRPGASVRQPCRS